jgi:ABC-type lipoprotein release transport system permease subunit
MGLIIKISLRNLWRQRRRTILLGTAIAFGMMILVLANSFSRGLGDIIFNQMLVHSNGHIQVSAIENGKIRGGVIRDKDRIIKIIRDNIPNVKEVNQQIASFTRVIGNGKSDMLAIVGLPANEDILSWFDKELSAGNVSDYTNPNIENPLVIAEDKAKDLNVKIGDSVNIRINTLQGQVQTAKLTVVATIKTANSFQGMAAYIPSEKQKAIMGYRVQESGPLQIVFNKMEDPKIALTYANKLHQLLQPDLAIIYGEARYNGENVSVPTFAFFSNTNALRILKENVKVIDGKLERALNSNVIMASSSLARDLNLRVGSKIQNIYQHKFDSESTTNVYTISGIFESSSLINKKFLMVSENNFYKGYYQNLPKDPVESNSIISLATNNPLYPALATEWKLLERTSAHDDYQKKLLKVQKEKWEGAYLDIGTMYEMASFIIQLEGALNTISLIAVLILFFIILVGVINTLRMTVRERTREIGTIRAIGMQRVDVKNTFIVETFFLAFFASIAGAIAAFLVMVLLSFWKINTDSIFSIFLLDKHLNFVPKAGGLILNLILLLLFGLEAFVISREDKIPQLVIRLVLIFSILIGFVLSASGGILTYLILILMMLIAIAYFPSRKASLMSAADALRHYE